MFELSTNLPHRNQKLSECDIQNMIVDLFYQNPTNESVFLDQISTGLL